MQRVNLVITMLAVAAMLALPACSNRKGSASDPLGTNNSGGNTMGSGSGY